MRKLGAARLFAATRVPAAGIVLAAAVFGVGTLATAEPAVSTPISVVFSMIPDGWEGRTDVVPMLQAQADGTAVKSPDAASEDRKRGTPPKQLKGRIAPEVLAAAATEAKSLGKVDMGIPTGGPKGSALLDFLGATPDQDIHLLNYTPAATDGLTEDQITNRHHFADLCRKLLNAFVENR